MPRVRPTGQCAGADGHALVLRVGCANQVVDGEAQGALDCRVALHPNVTGAPPSQPCLLVAVDQRGQLSPDRTLGVGARRVGGVVMVSRRADRNNAVQSIGLAELEAERQRRVRRIFGADSAALGSVKSTGCCERER